MSKKCEMWICPYHACMSNDCQITETAINAPHLIELLDYCDIPEMILAVQEVKQSESDGHSQKG